MLWKEIIAVCSDIPTQHISELCGHNVELGMLNLLMYRVTAGLKGVSQSRGSYNKTN